MTEIQRTNVEENDIDKQVSILDRLIADGEFDKAFQDVFGLPEAVVQSLGEIA